MLLVMRIQFFGNDSGASVLNHAAGSMQFYVLRTCDLSLSVTLTVPMALPCTG
jgi:hypothetical protein